MKKVTCTKVPTCIQLTNMTLNLQEKFGGSSSVNFENHTYSHRSGLSHQFWIHPGDGRCFNLNSWEETLDKYFELMKEKDAS